jgi:tRNA modification GTPase
VNDTIYALSSGAPPAAIAVVRISGPDAPRALELLTGSLPEPRRAALASLSWDGEEIDRALVLRFPRPRSATGEDIVELHLHGGRAVISAVKSALSSIEGLREAEPGEFTRRAFENGRIDLAEAEGLADLLEAETEGQRRTALLLAGGALSRQVEAWQARLLAIAAGVEAALDFDDEEDVRRSGNGGVDEDIQSLREELSGWLARPSAERLKEGLKVVIAGPPNAGKSNLLNAIAGRDAAITSPVPGTTRDVIEAPLALAGRPFLLTDTAGLRDSPDEIEAIGVERARGALETADIILWLGAPGEAPPGAVKVHSKCDLYGTRDDVELNVSAKTGAGIDELILLLIRRSSDILPAGGEVALHRRHREALGEALEGLADAADSSDLLIAAEGLRRARLALDRITGRAGVEDMLDSLFSRFCIGK